MSPTITATSGPEIQLKKSTAVSLSGRQEGNFVVGQPVIKRAELASSQYFAFDHRPKPTDCRWATTSPLLRNKAVIDQAYTVVRLPGSIALVLLGPYSGHNALSLIDAATALQKHAGALLYRLGRDCGGIATP